MKLLSTVLFLNLCNTFAYDVYVISSSLLLYERIIYFFGRAFFILFGELPFRALKDMDYWLLQIISEEISM